MCVQQQLEKIHPFQPVTSLSNSHLLDPQYAKGGPIIAVQVENEYGSYHQDKRYLKYIKKVSAPLIFLHIYIFLISLCESVEQT